MGKNINDNCTQITFLIEKEGNDIINTSEQLAIKNHLIICPGCRVYKQQSGFLNRMMTLYFKRPKYSRIKLSSITKNKLKARIMAKLDEEFK